MCAFRPPRLVWTIHYEPKLFMRPLHPPCTPHRDLVQRGPSGSNVVQVAHLYGASYPPGGYPAGATFSADFTSTGPLDDLAGADLANNRFVVPATGTYQVMARAYYCPQTSHYTTTQILVNGGGIAIATSPIAGGCRTDFTSEITPLNAGDVLTLVLYDSQNGPTLGLSNISMTVARLK